MKIKPVEKKPQRTECGVCGDVTNGAFPTKAVQCSLCTTMKIRHPEVIEWVERIVKYAINEHLENTNHCGRKS